MKFLKKKFGLNLLDTKPRVMFFIQVAFFTAFTNLTSGVFLTSLALYMGADDLLSSYVSIILNLCGVVILFFSLWIEKFKSRKKLAIGLTVLSRIVTMLIVAIPVIFPKSAQLGVFIPTVIIAFTLQAQTTVVVNQWMLGFMDQSKSGRYISLRQTLALIVSVALSLGGGYFMDAMGANEYLGFVLVFAFAGVSGLIEIVMLIFTPDSEPNALTENHKFFDIFRIPFKNKRYLWFCIYIFFFYTCLYICDSYTMVFLKKYLALPYATVNGLYMIMSLPQIFLLGIWGKISDKYGHEVVLKISITMFLGETGLMFFTSSTSWMYCIPIGFVFSSVANAGFTISVFNRRYELMPKKNRFVYDNFYTAVVGLAFIVGPLIGSGFKTLIENSPSASASLEFANFRWLYAIGSLGLAILQIVYIICTRRRIVPISSIVFACVSPPEEDASLNAFQNKESLSCPCEPVPTCCISVPPTVGGTPIGCGLCPSDGDGDPDGMSAATDAESADGYDSGDGQGYSEKDGLIKKKNNKS